VNIVVKGKVIGTVTDGNGKFSLKVADNPPFQLSVSYVTHKTLDLEVTVAEVKDLEIKLEEATTSLFEVTVTGASLTEESVVKAPVSVEKMNSLMVQSTPADNYYKGLINLKGVDMTTSSINFQIVNSRGFGSTGNTRFMQLTDGMDTQAPALNFPIGNLNGPSELDVESVEMIPGSASALYGPNAFNGVLLVNSKSPFEYQGLSAFIKSGINHIGDSTSIPTAPKSAPVLPRVCWRVHSVMPRHGATNSLSRLLFHTAKPPIGTAPTCKTAMQPAHRTAFRSIPVQIKSIPMATRFL